MRLSLRFVLPRLLALGLLGYAVVPLVDRLILGWFVRDLDMRATLVANTARERVHDLVRSRGRRRLLQYFSRLTEGERVFAVAFCPADGEVLSEMVLVHDLGFVARRSAETRKYIFCLFVGLGFIIALITVIIAQLSWRGCGPRRFPRSVPRGGALRG